MDEELQQQPQTIEEREELQNRLADALLTKTGELSSKMTEKEFYADQHIPTVGRIIHKAYYGKKFEGSDEEIARETYLFFNRFNANTASMATNSARLKDMPREVQAAFLYGMTAYDNKEITAKGTALQIANTLIDPTTYIGAGLYHKAVLRNSATAGLQASLRKWLSKGAVVGATEGAAYSTAHNIGEQNVKVQAGVKDDISAGEAVGAAAIGAGAGAALGKGAEAVASVLKGRGAKNISEAPKIDKPLSETDNLISIVEKQAKELEEAAKKEVADFSAPIDKKIGKTKDKTTGFVKTPIRELKEAKYSIHDSSKTTHHLYSGDVVGTEKIGNTPVVGIKDGYGAMTVVIPRAKVNWNTLNFISSLDEVPTKDYLSNILSMGKKENEPNWAYKDMSKADLDITKSLFSIIKGELDVKSKSTEEIYNGAQKLAQDPKFNASLMHGEISGEVSAEANLAAGKIFNNQWVKILELEAKAKKSLDEKELAMLNDELNTNMYYLMNTAKAYTAYKNQSSRALSIFQGRHNKERDRIALLQTMGTVTGLTPQKMREILARSQLDFNSAVRMVKGMEDSLLTKSSRVFIESYLGSILSSSKTMIVNIVGSALRVGMDIPDTAMAIMLGKVMKSTNEEKMFAGELQAKMYGLSSSFLEALRMGQKTLTTGKQYKGLSKADDQTKYITADYLGLDRNSVAGKMVDTFGTIVRAPMERGIGAGDAFFRYWGERASLSQTAYRQATLENLTGQAKIDRITTLMENPTDLMKQRAQSLGDDFTFQTDLIDGSFAKRMQELSNSNPLIKVIQPLVKTSANLLSQAFYERTPIGLMKERIRTQILAGGVEGQEAAARMLNGSILMFTGAGMASAGLITGGAPRNKSERDALTSTGWQEYSLKIGDNYYSYSRMEPFSYLFKMFADLNELQAVYAHDDGNVNQKEYDDLILSGAALIANFLTSNSFLGSTSSVMAGIQSQSLSSSVANVINGAIPFAGTRSDIIRAFDDGAKEVSGVMERVKSKMPYFNKDLPPSVDIFGEHIKYKNVLTPFPVSEKGESLIRDELLRLHEATGLTAFGKPSKQIEGVDLDTKQYYRLMRILNETNIDGIKYEDHLSELVSQDWYKEANDKQKVMLLSKVSQRANKRAREILKSEDENLRKDIISQKLNKLGINKGVFDGIQ